MTSTICLNMIVRNEEENLTTCFDSIFKYINYYVISDTGSTDNTINFIKEYFQNKGIEGKIFQDEWVDFGTNRTIALEHARRESNAEYVFIMDADDYLEGELIFPSVMTGDSYFLKLRNEHSSNIYRRELLFKNVEPWKYLCPVHEYPVCDKQNVTQCVLDGNYEIISRRKGPIRNKNNNSNCVMNDINLLIDYLNTTEGKKIVVQLHCFCHIGLGYQALKQYNDAIIYFKKYIQLCKSDDVKRALLWYAYYCVGNCMLDMGIKNNDELEECYTHLVDGYNVNPSQNECLITFGETLIKHFNYEKALEVYTLASKNTKIPLSLYFVNTSLYQENLWNAIINGLNIAIAIKSDPKWSNYKFCLMMESTNKTFIKSETCSLLTAKKLCDRLIECSGFNTKGEFKTGKITNITYTGEFLQFNGLFIKQRTMLVINLGYSTLTNRIDNYPLSNNKAYGSELCAINLAKQMTDFYDVFIVSDDNINRNVDGIMYCNNESFENYLKTSKREIDILILSRYIHYFVDYSYKTRKTFLWLHDTEIGGGYNGVAFKGKVKPLLHNIMDKLDKVVVLTEWHKQLMGTNFDIDETKMKIIGNGIPEIQTDKLEKIDGKFIWTSSLYRGIERCVEYFHLIKKKMPNAVLHIFRDYDGFEHLVDKWDYIKFYGKVTNERIVQEFKTASIWFYPTNFYETYCISALEAQANGCLCVATNIGSLANVISDRGYLMDESIASNKEKCVNFLLDCLQKDNTKMIEDGIKFAKQRTWDNVKDEWLELFAN